MSGVRVDIKVGARGEGRRGRASTMPMLAVALGVLLGAGCASTPPPPPPSAPAPAQSVPTRPTTTAPLEAPTPRYAGPWEDPSNPLYQRTIYFDYDTAEIKPDFLPVLRTHARYLGSDTSRRVTLEGHTDERGTREYNLALSDQRADAVRRVMIADGVLPNQLATLSYGEERPASPGHGEASWRQNRRVVIQY